MRPEASQDSTSRGRRHRTSEGPTGVHLWSWGGKPTLAVFSNKGKVAGWRPRAWHDKDRSSGKVVPTPILRSWVSTRPSRELAAAARKGKPWKGLSFKRLQS